MRFDTLRANERGTLATKGLGFPARTQLANGFLLALSFLHFTEQVDHSVDEERRWQLSGVVLRELGLFPALGAGHGLADSRGKPLETLGAVVVEARQDLGLSVVPEADGARDLFFQLFKCFREVGSFSHGDREDWQRRRTVKVREKNSARTTPYYSTAHAQKGESGLWSGNETRNIARDRMWM